MRTGTWSRYFPLDEGTIQELSRFMLTLLEASISQIAYQRVLLCGDCFITKYLDSLRLQLVMSWLLTPPEKFLISTSTRFPVTILIKKMPFQLLYSVISTADEICLDPKLFTLQDLDQDLYLPNKSIQVKIINYLINKIQIWIEIS